MKKKVRVEIELLNPYIFMLKEKYSDLIKELFFKMLDDIENSNIKIKLDEMYYEISTEIKPLVSDHVRGYGMLNLYFEVDIDKIWNYEEAYDNKGNKIILTEEEKYGHKECDLRTETEKFVMDFTFAMNLAYPGLFEFSCAKIFIDNIEQKLCEIGLTLTEWSEPYFNYLEEGWPQIHILNFKQVWEWLSEKTNYINSGMSKTAIDRALSALSYTMGNPGYEKMFYILIGLEAIYNDNKNIGITEQLRTKTELLLKRPIQYKKKISNFYDKRSEFIHGKMNFPNSYYKYDATKEFEDFFFNKYVTTVDNALAILLATIQEYIIQNANQLEIEMNIKLL